MHLYNVGHSNQADRHEEVVDISCMSSARALAAILPKVPKVNRKKNNVIPSVLSYKFA